MSYTADQRAFADARIAEGMEPLLANILCKEPLAPKYARLQVAMCCNGSGQARGERLLGIAGEALEEVRRLEVALAAASLDSQETPNG